MSQTLRDRIAPHVTVLRLAALKDKEYFSSQPDSTLLQGMSCSVPAAFEGADTYRTILHSGQRTFAHVIVWARVPPSDNTSVGEIGDVWVAVPEDSPARLYTKGLHGWREEQANLLGSSQAANVLHRAYKDRQLVLTDGRLEWLVSSSAKKKRSLWRKTHGETALTNSEPLLRVLYEARLALVANRPLDCDPEVLSTAPAVYNRRDTGSLDNPFATYQELAVALQ